ncbi:HET-domain-containing protein [Cucurbitaria berberidis CBS 394.84]|uniref:HET-domain-containing protein n=1 Tax=Cucurbitaria berberidis CBS 394.84 TaxID=1168544 RepID=A0A9P4GRR4_9PLEO|nr:HET-domain-containing protein [Cucurbitaria berberidis CBS 394.84]KAF1850201.1 HET-domain-containing protein [Cucurbitaria berberidis CBS 394.84]
MFCNQCQAFWHETFSKAKIPQAIHSCEDVHWEYHETTLHNSIRDLKQASDLRCRLCRIIYFTPTDHEHETLLKDVDEPLSIVLTIDPSKGPHPVLSAEFREKSGDGARISKRMVASCSGLLSDENLTTTLKTSAESNNDSTGSDGALELAAFWTKTCLDGHDKCRPPAGHGASSFVPTRLLDVSSNSIRLIESEQEIKEGSDRSFVALSHCWGLIPIIRTLIDNYDEHRKGIAPERLSKTFREAVHATRKLGYRYIWIDSLCIKQDDGEDWAAEAATMCDVYQYATLTIAAAHAPGGDVGCYAERDGLLQLPFFIELPQSAVSKEPTRIQFTSYGRVKDIGGGNPALYGRAWVLQEQLLSPRMLIFDGAQIKWECLTMHGSEKSPTSSTTRHSLYYKYCGILRCAFE